MTPSSTLVTSDSAFALLVHAEETIKNALLHGCNGRFAEVESLAMRLADLQVDTSRTLDVLLNATRAGYLDGRPFRAMAIARHAYDLAGVISDKVKLFDARLLIGVCAADTGNTAEAMISYDECFVLSRALKDDLRERRVWTNLGVALMYAGHYREALVCYDRIIEAGVGTAGSHPVMLAFGNSALCRLCLGEIPAGLAAIQKAKTLQTDPADSQIAQNLAIFENTHTRLLAETGDQAGARRHANLSEKYARLANSPRAQVYAKAASGVAAAVEGAHELSLRLMRESLEECEKTNSTRKEIVQTMVKVCELVGRPEKALEYLNTLLDEQRILKRDNALRNIREYLDHWTPIHEDDAIRNLTMRVELNEGRLAKSSLAKAKLDAMTQMAVTSEMIEDPRGLHAHRVGAMAGLLAHECALASDEVGNVDIAGRLHDIGKSCMPESLMRLPDKPRDAERKMLEQHTLVGADLLAEYANEPWARVAMEVATCHHEWWDGTGFPRGLAGEAIPLSARIVALADVFDALTHLRPYRPAMSVTAALASMASFKGRQFDPTLTDAFIRLLQKLMAEGGDLDMRLGLSGQQTSLVKAMSGLILARKD